MAPVQGIGQYLTYIVLADPAAIASATCRFDVLGNKPCGLSKKLIKSTAVIPRIWTLVSLRRAHVEKWSTGCLAGALDLGGPMAGALPSASPVLPQRAAMPRLLPGRGRPGGGVAIGNRKARRGPLYK